jgi:hypothetical protein
MPMALVMMFASGLAPRVAARIGRRSTMASGIFLGGAGLALMAAFVSVDGGYLSVLPGMLAMGLGMGLSTARGIDAITIALPRKRQGVASALNDVAREFGTALGVALLGAVLSAGYRDAIDSQLDGVPGAASPTPSKLPMQPDPGRTRSSVPPRSPSSTVGRRPCGQASPSWQSCLSTSSSGAPSAVPPRRRSRLRRPKTPLPGETTGRSLKRVPRQ